MINECLLLGAEGGLEGKQAGRKEYASGYVNPARHLAPSWVGSWRAKAKQKQRQ